MTSVPKPLKFLRPGFGELVGVWEGWPEGKEKVSRPTSGARREEIERRIRAKRESARAERELVSFERSEHQYLVERSEKAPQASVFRGRRRTVEHTASEARRRRRLESSESAEGRTRFPRTGREGAAGSLCEPARMVGVINDAANHLAILKIQCLLSSRKMPSLKRWTTLRCWDRRDQLPGRGHQSIASRSC